MDAMKNSPEPLRLRFGKVGTGCPFYRVSRIPPSEPVRAVSSCIRLSTYSWLLQSAVAVSISTTTAVFETSYAVALPPRQVGFHADYSALIPLSVPHMSVSRIHYRPTSGNTATPLPCRNVLFRQSRIFSRKQIQRAPGLPFVPIPS